MNKGELVDEVAMVVVLNRDALKFCSFMIRTLALSLSSPLEIPSAYHWFGKICDVDR